MRTPRTVQALTSGFTLNLLLALSLLIALPSTATAQFAPWDSLIVTPEGSADTVHIGLDVDTQSVETRFFAHDDFGFDGATFVAIGNDLSHAASRAATRTNDAFQGSAGDVFARVFPWFVLLFLVGLALGFERRARRGFVTIADFLDAKHPAPAEWRRIVRRELVTGSGALVVPTVAWLLSYVPIQGLFDSAPWSQALSQGLGLFVVFRLGVLALDMALAPGLLQHVPDESRVRLRRAAVSSSALVLAFAIANDTLSTIQYRQDAQALGAFLMRLSITLLSLRVWTRRNDIIALLPAEGSTRYLAFRDVFAKGYTYLTVISFALFGLWTAGFTRAASTILLRSYGIVALVTIAALLRRAFDRYVERTEGRGAPLATALVDTIDGYARAVLICVFGWLVLRLLGLDEPLIGLLKSIRVTVGEQPITVLGVVRAVAVMLVAVLVSRVTRVLTDYAFYPTFGIEEGAGYALNTAIHYFIIALSLGMAVVALGVDLAGLTVFLGALGVGIGFGLQDMARNFAAGFVLLFGRALEKGDVITVQDVSYGRIEEISGRIVKVKTKDNQELIIPSNELVASTITNWTHGDPFVRLIVPVGVSYGSDVYDVRAALMEAALESAVVSRDHAPEVRFEDFGSSSLDFALLFWVDVTRHDPREAQSDLRFAIWSKLNERDIEIPFPQRVLHLAPEAATVVASLASPSTGDP